MEIPGVTNYSDTEQNRTYGKQQLGREDFMKLLLKELNHQDPLNPMDSKEFTVQLTQFSSLEELTNINDTLAEVLSFQRSAQDTSAANLIGRSVSVEGNSVYLKDTANMSYELADDAVSVNLVIRNANEEIVRIEPLGARTAGAGVYNWDGKDNTGNDVPEGLYSFDIIAEGKDGLPVAAFTEGSGKVTGINFEEGDTSLVLNGGRTVYLSDVSTIRE